MRQRGRRITAVAVTLLAASVASCTPAPLDRAEQYPPLVEELNARANDELPEIINALDADITRLTGEGQETGAEGPVQYLYKITAILTETTTANEPTENELRAIIEDLGYEHVPTVSPAIASSTGKDDSGSTLTLELTPTEQDGISRVWVFFTSRELHMPGSELRRLHDLYGSTAAEPLSLPNCPVLDQPDSP